MISLVTSTFASLIALFFVIGYVTYAFFNRSAGRAEIGSEIELAANRKEYFDDEILEGKRLQKMQLLGVLMLATITIGLPAYWILEPSRQANATSGKENRFIEWGSNLFAPTAEGGFNCAGCHGIAAQGLVGPDLHGVDSRKNNRQLIQQVVSGRTPPMPRFQPEPQAMADLLAYLHTLT